MRLIVLTAACFGLALAGCDTATSPDLAAASTVDARGGNGPGAPSGDAAVYEARLTPLNADENGMGVTGLATFTVDESSGTFTAMVDARGLAVATPVHPQHIHAGAECPTMADDANGDGVLDVLEGLPDYGPILVPLDGDLADLGAQAETFPTAESVRGRPDYGVIDYEETAPLSDLLMAVTDALDEEPFIDEDGTPLFGTDLALETRHVVLHGVAPSTDLPDTVQSIGDLPAFLTLPVACGEIRRVR